jgi:hypothetical protein
MFALPPNLTPPSAGDIMTYRRQVTDAPPEATYEERQRRSCQQAGVLRELLEGNEPITFRAYEEANGGDVT